ncbi:hypothetical protein OF158_01010 [Weizmannia sp. WK01]|uniref:hypothetical protein n=1 Tax=Weizmannia sp. WK01 TaxID=2984845 RepID=UPI0021F80F08|nr:hypothetical protein [Weizmannia sp. WK01]UYT05028.1 hypothetical protein OF158_01010 [Weizmannia sp. WK01]
MKESAKVQEALAILQQEGLTQKQSHKTLTSHMNSICSFAFLAHGTYFYSVQYGMSGYF